MKSQYLGKITLHIKTTNNKMIMLVIMTLKMTIRTIMISITIHLKPNIAIPLSLSNKLTSKLEKTETYKHKYVHTGYSSKSKSSH